MNMMMTKMMGKSIANKPKEIQYEVISGMRKVKIYEEKGGWGGQ